jgi:CTP:molybdopterin cytidylyltransferase MocA
MAPERSGPEIGAVILAAGAGRRLGGVAKACLGGDDPFLARIARAARAVGLARGVVVVGPPFEGEVAALARGLGLEVVCNPAPERGMASSVARGFAALAASPAVDAAWLWPVDHPAVTIATLRALIAARGDHLAAIPRHGGRGGHPPLIGRGLFAALAGVADLPGGARACLAAAATIAVEVDDPGVIRDVDTPAALEALA